MAGERLVLAELIVDSGGVVRGVREATESFKFLPDNLEKHGRQAANIGDKYLGALEHRFLGFRHVAGAILGGFTVAGIVSELVSLGAELVKNTEVWHDWSVGVQDALHAIGGETGVEATIRNVNEAMKSAGVASKLASGETAQSIIKAMADVQRQIGLMQGPARKEPFSLSALLIGIAEPFGPLKPVEGGPLTEKQLILQHELQGDLKSLKEKLLDVQIASGLTAETFDKLWGTDTQHTIIEATRLVEDFGESVKRATEKAKPATKLSGNIFNESTAQPLGSMEGRGTPLGAGVETSTIEGGFHNVEVAADGVVIHLEQVRDEFGHLTGSVNDSTAALGGWADTAALSVEDINTGPLEKLTDRMIKATVAVNKAEKAYANWAIVAPAAYEAVASAAQTGVISQENATRITLSLLAAEAALKGQIELAAGFATAEWDPVGSALHFAAAALYFVAAGFDVAGAIRGAGGGGGGGGGGGATGVSAAAPAGPTQQQEHLTVIFEGPTFGFNQALLVRYLEDAKRRSAGSNP